MHFTWTTSSDSKQTWEFSLRMASLPPCTKVGLFISREHCIYWWTICRGHWSCSMWVNLSLLFSQYLKCFYSPTRLKLKTERREKLHFLPPSNLSARAFRPHLMLCFSWWLLLKDGVILLKWGIICELALYPLCTLHVFSLHTKDELAAVNKSQNLSMGKILRH